MSLSNIQLTHPMRTCATFPCFPIYLRIFRLNVVDKILRIFRHTNATHCLFIFSVFLIACRDISTLPRVNSSQRREFFPFCFTIENKYFVCSEICMHTAFGNQLISILFIRALIAFGITSKHCMLARVGGAGREEETARIKFAAAVSLDSRSAATIISSICVCRAIVPRAAQSSIRVCVAPAPIVATRVSSVYVRRDDMIETCVSFFSARGRQGRSGRGGYRLPHAGIVQNINLLIGFNRKVHTFNL